MGDLVPRGLRGTVTGCMQFFMFIMQAILQIVVGLLYAFISPSLPFLLLAVAAIPISIFVFWKVYEPSVKEVQKERRFYELNCRHTFFIICLFWHIGLKCLSYVRWVYIDGFWVCPSHLEVFSVRANDV